MSRVILIFTLVLSLFACEESEPDSGDKELATGDPNSAPDGGTRSIQGDPGPATAINPASVEATERPSTDNAATPSRIALTIGNARYANVTSLKNPVADAALLGRSLRSIGFSTRIAKDLSKDALQGLLMQEIAARTQTDVAIIYYAGHAVQIGGENYLVPVEFATAGGTDPRAGLFPVASLVEMIEASGIARAVIVLDACRDNPFGAVSDGLAQPSAIRSNRAEITFLYATAPGQVALDGAGKNSLFASALAQWIAQPGTAFRDVVQATTRDVSALTGGAQVPWLSGNFSSPLILAPAATQRRRPVPREIRALAGRGDLVLKPDVAAFEDKNARDSERQSQWTGNEDIRLIAVSKDGQRTHASTCQRRRERACRLTSLARRAIEGCQRNGGTCAVLAMIRNGGVSRVWDGKVTTLSGTRTDSAFIDIRLDWDGVGEVTGKIDISRQGLSEMELALPDRTICRGTYRFEPSSDGGNFNGVCPGGLTYSGTFARQRRSAVFTVTGQDAQSRAIAGTFAFPR